METTIRRRVYRQGDVILREKEGDVKLLKEELASSKIETLEIGGEASRHKHAISGHVMRSGDKVLLLLEEPTQITHPQHAPLEIPAGTYDLYRTKEFHYSMEQTWHGD